MERMSFTRGLDDGRAASERRRRGPFGPRAPVYAALDLGTNNCRLLIARRAGPSFRVIDAFSRIVRLGEGMGQESHLSEAAVARTLEALKVCAAKMRHRAVTHARGVATEACRRAVNGPSFLARVAAETGLELEVISPAEEARLAVSPACRFSTPRSAMPCSSTSAAARPSSSGSRRCGQGRRACSPRSRCRSAW